jgi:hypothetical protein
MKHMTAEEFAIEMNVPVRTARRLIKKEMMYVQVGRQLRVRFDVFTQWQARQTRNTPIPLEVGLRMVEIMRGQHGKTPKTEWEIQEHKADLARSRKLADDIRAKAAAKKAAAATRKAEKLAKQTTGENK